MKPTPALSIREPWAGLVALGLKRIENRNWPTKYRGPFLIHAGKALDIDADWSIKQALHPVAGSTFLTSPAQREVMALRGGIIGMAEIVDCVQGSGDPFFVGDYGFVIENARLLPFQPCRGLLGFFTPGAEWSPPNYLDGGGDLAGQGLP